jgi:hypothetical protein
MRIPVIFLYGFLALSVHSFGQDAASCPVKISRVILSRPDSFSILGLDNLTDRAVSGVKLELVYLDNVKDEHPSVFALVTDGMKPRKWVNYSWHTSGAEYVRGPYILRVQKVLYKDDSVWTPTEGAANPCEYRHG